MIQRMLVALVTATAILAGSAWAAEEEKKVINGPGTTAFGELNLVLGQGASAETQYQPDASRLVVRTLVGEARVVTSARNLILVENTEGRVEILLPNGRVIQVEPGKSEIVGRTLVENPGNIVVRLAGSGPIAQVGGGPPIIPATLAVVTVLATTPAGALRTQEVPEGSPFATKPQPLSPSSQ